MGFLPTPTAPSPSLFQENGGSSVLLDERELTASLPPASEGEQTLPHAFPCLLQSAKSRQPLNEENDDLALIPLSQMQKHTYQINET